MQPINATGVKGFLKWLQQFQPAIYAKIAPELPRKAPELFSDFEASGGIAGYMSRGLEGLGDDASLGLQPINLTATDMAVPTVDVADAANSGTASSSSTDWLSSLINGVSQAYMGVTNAQTQQQIVNAQLQRAQAGLPPLTITPGEAGVPQIGIGSSSRGWLIGAGLAAAVGFFMLSSSRRR